MGFRSTNLMRPKRSEKNKVVKPQRFFLFRLEIHQNPLKATHFSTILAENPMKTLHFYKSLVSLQADLGKCPFPTTLFNTRRYALILYVKALETYHREQERS